MRKSIRSTRSQSAQRTALAPMIVMHGEVDCMLAELIAPKPWAIPTVTTLAAIMKASDSIARCD